MDNRDFSVYFLISEAHYKLKGGVQQLPHPAFKHLHCFWNFNFQHS